MEKVIERGILKKRAKGFVEYKEYTIRLIGLEYLDEILKLQDLIVQSIDDLEIFEPDDRDFFIREVANGAKIIGVFSNEGRDKLIAYRLVTFPKGESMNLGVDLNIPEDELDKVAHLETTIVHPHYRGNSLQKKTLYIALDIIREMGYRHICSTVSPKNYYSLKNVMAGGLVIKSLKEKYGGKLRFILHRDLKDDGIKNYRNVISLSDVNIVKKEKLLEKGYVGYLARKNDYSYEIEYGATC